MLTTEQRFVNGVKSFIIAYENQRDLGIVAAINEMVRAAEIDSSIGLQIPLETGNWLSLPLVKPEMDRLYAAREAGAVPEFLKILQEEIEKSVQKP